MQKGKRLKLIKRRRRIILLFGVLVTVVSASLLCFQFFQSPEPTSVEASVNLPDIASAPAKMVSQPIATPEPTPEVFTPDETEVKMLAQMLWGEARGILSDTEKAACVWSVLNRVDDETGAWPDTIAGVLTQKHQFIGYSPDHPASDALKALAEDVLARWHQEKTEGGNVGRVLPANYFFFTGDGQRNHFRAEYQDTTNWDWSLPSPYEN